MEIIAALTRRMLKHKGLEQVAVSVHFTLDEAIRGASFVLTQLRVGQLAARAADERLGLKYHLLGQETTGVGGFAKALRTIPVILQMARKVEQLAPEAFILNFTNPAGIVTEAVSRYSKAKIIGLCNVPINMQHMIVGMLGAQESEVKLRFAGLNHMVWVHKVLQGREDVTGKVIDMLCDGKALSMNNIKELPWPAEFLRALKAIPCPYHRYFWLTPAMLAEEIAAAKTKGTRAEQVMKSRAGAVCAVRRPAAGRKTGATELSRRRLLLGGGRRAYQRDLQQPGRGDGGEYPQQRRDSWPG
ncbi:6-phospho-beta-glucosidase [Klebsiella pneumoniae]|nr:6-phospho-beta-glucosidase [Klebsiella pneumoniae]